MFKVRFFAHIALVLLMTVPVMIVRTGAQVAPTTTAVINGSVSATDGKPVANADVSLNGPKNASMRSDAQGLFVFVGVPYGTYRLSVVAQNFGTAMRSISVEGDTNVAIQYEALPENGLKTIAQVASNARAQFNVTAASVSQVNPMAKAFQGTTTWRTILAQIPGISLANIDNATGAAIPDNPLQPVSISVNGSLPYETATLLDDMPLVIGNALGGGTNLAFLPLNGFTTVDVVRGPGANAPSIVNSIGGSVVFHAPGSVTADHYEFSLSNGTYGGIVANGLAAVRWKKLSAVVTYGVNHQPGALQNAAGVASSVGLYGYPDTINGETFTPYAPPCVAPGCNYGGQLYNANYTDGSNRPVNYGQQTGVLYCCVDQRSTWNQHNGSIGLTYQPSPALSFQIFWIGQNSLEPSNSSMNQVDFLPPSGYNGSIAPGVYSLQGNAGTLFGSSPYQQSSSMLEEKVTAQIGRGQLRAEALQARSFSVITTNAPGAPETVQLWGAGYLNGSPTLTYFNGQQVTGTFCAFHYEDTSSVSDREVLLSYTTPIGDAFHAGVSFVRGYANAPDAYSEAIYGSVYTGNVDSANSQTTNELRIFAGGNPSEKTSLDLSGYFTNANYHTLVGTDWVDTHFTYAAPRLGFVWRPSGAIAIRAAAGGGFAEAPLSDYIGQPGIANYGTYYLNTAPNANLQPEKSFGFDVGAEVKMRGSNILSFDAYRTTLYGQLYSAAIELTNNYLGTGLPLFSDEYGNLGVSRMEGILVELRHDVPRGMYWTASGGLTRGYIMSLPANFYNVNNGVCSPASLGNCANLGVVPGPNFNGNYEISVPYAQALGTLGYRWNPQKYVELVGTYYGNNNAYYRPAFVEVDGHAGYPLTRNVSVLATFQNITGIYDGSILALAQNGFFGAPTLFGPPIGISEAPYGIRTIIMTLQVHL